MNILITGGTGFIGSHLTDALLQQGHNVTTLSRTGGFAFPVSTHAPKDKLKVVSGSVTDPALMFTLLRSADVLIHNASAVGAQGTLQSGSEYLATNVGGTSCIAEVLTNRPHSVKKIILGSSISVYGEGNYDCRRCGIVRPLVRNKKNWQQMKGWNPECPICKGATTPAQTPESATCNGEHLYAATKKYQEEMIALAARTAEISTTIFRYATVYGPGQRHRNPYIQMLNRISCGAQPVLFEDGLQTRDFIEVGDVVRANLLALESRNSQIESFNIGSGLTRSLIDFVRLLSSRYSALSGSAIVEPVIKNTLSPGDIRHCSIDCDAAAESLNFRAAVDLEKGVDRLISWCVQRQNPIARIGLDIPVASA